MKRLIDNSDVSEARSGTLSSSQRWTKLHSYSPTDKWITQAASTMNLKKREFVDSGASMHMVSKRDLNSAELENRRIRRR